MQIDITTPSVAVLILNYNQWKMTLECVESVLQSEYSTYKIFLMDNGSHNQIDFEKMKSVASDKCEVFRIELNRGYVGGMNFGLEQASVEGFDFFLVMNNDAVLAPNAITELVNTAKKYQSKCIVSGKVYHFDRPNVLQFIGIEIVNRKSMKMRRLVNDEEDQGQWDQEMELDMLDDIFWLLPRQVYQSVGGYSPYFWFNAEQADLALRAVKNGYKLIFTPKAKLWHKGSVTIGGRSNNPRLTYYNSQANLIFKYLHLSRFYFLAYYYTSIIRIIKNFFKANLKYLFFKKTEFDNLKADFMALCYFNKWVFNKQANTGATPFDK